MDAKPVNNLRVLEAVCFNPRARDGREEHYLGVKDNSTSFNPRARDGRELCTDVRQETLMCFNPRARDGREVSLCCCLLADTVSIHAPVMDAK